MLVKFGNNWIQKIPNWTACSPITYTNLSCILVVPLTETQVAQIIGRPVGSVGRVPDYRAGGRGFKARPDQHSGSLNN